MPLKFKIENYFNIFETIFEALKDLINIKMMKIRSERLFHIVGDHSFKSDDSEQIFEFWLAEQSLLMRMRRSLEFLVFL